MASGGIFEAKIKELKKRAKQTKGITLEVGFFEGATYPEIDGGEKVAEVAYKNEFGVPENNQPPRPFFRNAINKNKDKWTGNLSKYLENDFTIEQAFETVGTEIVVDIKNSIRDFNDPPISETTQKIKKAKKSQHPDETLIDTETMYNAVTWSIKHGD